MPRTLYIRHVPDDVALAEQLGATLLTADVRAARAPGLQCPVEVIAPLAGRALRQPPDGAPSMIC